MAVTTPDAVPGELITAAWGDAVRADLTTLTTDVAARVQKAGDTMSGNLVAGAPPTATVTGTAVRTDGVFNSTVGGAATPSNLPNVICQRVDSGPATVGAQFIRFSRLATQDVCGTITITGATSCAYNTTSDPRVKTPPPPTRGIGDAAARALALGRTAWRGQYLDLASGQGEGETFDFLSSHDIEDVAGYAVTGERDAVDAEGKPVYQQVNFAGLVPLLFAALADALERIAILEGIAP